MSALISIFFPDSAYFDNESYEVFIPTAWIPLLDTNELNGGMEVSGVSEKLQCKE